MNKEGIGTYGFGRKLYKELMSDFPLNIKNNVYELRDSDYYLSERWSKKVHEKVGKMLKSIPYDVNEKAESHQDFKNSLMKLCIDEAAYICFEEFKKVTKSEVFSPLSAYALNSASSEHVKNAMDTNIKRAWIMLDMLGGE